MKTTHPWVIRVVSVYYSLVYPRFVPAQVVSKYDIRSIDLSCISLDRSPIKCPGEDSICLGFTSDVTFLNLSGQVTKSG